MAQLEVRPGEDAEPHDQHVPDDDREPGPPRGPSTPRSPPARRPASPAPGSPGRSARPRWPARRSGRTSARAAPAGPRGATGRAARRGARGPQRRGQPERRHHARPGCPRPPTASDEPAVELAAPREESRVERDHVRGPRGEEALEDAAQEDDPVDRGGRDAGIEHELGQAVEVHDADAPLRAGRDGPVPLDLERSVRTRGSSPSRWWNSSVKPAGVRPEAREVDEALEPRARLERAHRQRAEVDVAERPAAPDSTRASRTSRTVPTTESQ